METWQIVLLCTVFAWIIIGADMYVKLVWLPKRREMKETQEREVLNVAHSE